MRPESCSSCRAGRSGTAWSSSTRATASGPDAHGFVDRQGPSSHVSEQGLRGPGTSTSLQAVALALRCVGLPAEAAPVRRSAPARAVRGFRLEADLELSGRTLSGRRPPAADAPRSDASIHPRLGARGPGVRMTGRVARARCRGSRRRGRVAGGPPGSAWSSAPDGLGASASSRGRANALEGRLGGESARSGSFSTVEHARVRRFRVSGLPPSPLCLLATEALLGRGRAWRTGGTGGPLFRHARRRGEGAGARAKWSFHGDGFTLWSPRARAGRGRRARRRCLQERLDLRAPEPAPRARSWRRSPAVRTARRGAPARSGRLWSTRSSQLAGAPGLSGTGPGRIASASPRSGAVFRASLELAQVARQEPRPSEHGGAVGLDPARHDASQVSNPLSAAP